MTSIKEEVVTKPLTELVSLVRGVSYTKGMERREPAPGYIRLLRANNIQGDLVFNDVIYVPHTCVKPDQILRRGDIVVAMSSGSKSVVGKTAQHWEQSEPTTFGAFCCVLRPNASVDPAFLGWFLRTEQYRQFISEISAGVNINNLKREYFEQVEVPTPSLAQQEATAQIIGALVTATSSPRERLATIPALLKKFRQSVLAAAWQEATERGEIKDLVEICESLTDGDHQPPPKSASGIPFITISALEGAVLSIGAAKRFVPNSYLESLDSKRKAKSGDVLYSVTGSIGVPALVETDEPFVFQRHIAILRPNLSEVSSKYMYYLLLSEQALNQGRDCATGIAQMTIPLRGLRKYQVPVPSHEMQSEIVRRVESLFALADSIESRLAEATAQVERTTQAILAKALRGELMG